MLWCEIGPDLPACIRLLELENTKTQGRHFGAKIASCGFCVLEFEEANNMCENVRENHGNHSNHSAPKPQKTKTTGVLSREHRLVFAEDVGFEPTRVVKPARVPGV